MVQISAVHPRSDRARRPTIAALAALILVATTSCGGSSDASAPRSTTETTARQTTASASTTTTAAAAATTVVTTAVPTTAAVPPIGYGPYGVTVEERAWTDSSRPTARPGSAAIAGRKLPVRLYLPTEAGHPVVGPAPVFVWSHGLDASVDYFDELLRGWASRGYLVAAPSFPLTNRDAGATVYDDVANQPADVSFVLDQVAAELGPTGTKRPGLADMERVAVGGHSLGAITSLAMAGSPCCDDPRVKAVVAVDGSTPGFADGSAPVRAPILLIHGTADKTFPADDSRAIFDTATGERYLVLMQGAPHTPFLTPGPAEVAATTIGDFLDLVLKHRPDGLDLLRDHATVEGVSTFES